MEVDEEISEQLQELFQQTYKEKTYKGFTLTFTIKGVSYTTIFYGFRPRDSLSFELFLVPRAFQKGSANAASAFSIKENSCIRISHEVGELTLVDDVEQLLFDSHISANSPTKQCFEPVLKSDVSTNNVSKRYTTTDVLQVLKTKLSILFPKVKEILLADAATKDAVSLSAFKFLHRQPSLYEKYGYESNIADELKAYLETVTIESLEEPIYKKVMVGVGKLGNVLRLFPDLIPSKYPSVKAILEDLTGRPLSPKEKLLDVYTSVTFEREIEFAHYLKDLAGSTKDLKLNFVVCNLILNYVSQKMGFPLMISYTLNRDSEAWKYWNSQLLFTDLNVIPKEETKIPLVLLSGGRKKQRRTYQRRKTLKKRKN